MNLPNKLTVFRVIAVPFFIGCLMVDHGYAYLAGLIIFVVASFTDFLDGYIARKHNLVTNFGKLMDPLADKILVVAALVMMLGVPVLSVPHWAIVVIIAREFFVTGFRQIAVEQGVVLAANNWGKIKTVLQMGYITVCLVLATWMMLIDSSGLSVHEWVGHFSYWGGAVVGIFTLISGVQMAWVNWARLGLDDL